MTTGKGPANSPEALTAMPCRESPAPEPAAHERALPTLSPAECLGLLEAGGIGRVGFASADGSRCCRSTSRSRERPSHLEPWAGGARDVDVRITPTRISGRCIEPGWASPWRQTPKPRLSALSQLRQDESTDDITLSEGEDRGQRAHPRRSVRPRQTAVRSGSRSRSGRSVQRRVRRVPCSGGV